LHPRAGDTAARESAAAVAAFAAALTAVLARRVPFAVPPALPAVVPALLPAAVPTTVIVPRCRRLKVPVLMAEPPEEPPDCRPVLARRRRASARRPGKGGRRRCREGGCKDDSDEACSLHTFSSVNHRFTHQLYTAAVAGYSVASPTTDFGSWIAGVRWPPQNKSQRKRS
jgi:hypothetical protein